MRLAISYETYTENIFPCPHEIRNPKCIMCKIKDGSFDEARRDLELYTISDITKKTIKEKQKEDGILPTSKEVGILPKII